MKYNINHSLHSDFSVFEQNKLPARSYFIPFSDEKALEKTDYKNERYNSDRIIWLYSGNLSALTVQKQSLFRVR